MATVATEFTAIQTDPEVELPGLALPELFEVIDGEVVECPPMGFKQLAMANELKRIVDRSLAHSGLGRFFVECLFDLRPAANRNRRPDGAFLSFDRWPKSKPFPEENALPAVPELAVEFVSRHDSATDLIDKVHEYFAAGCRLVWVVFPSVEQVYVYESNAKVRILGRDETIDGGGVLPGFSLALAELFGPKDEEGSAG